jgi:UDP-2,3-diacylglucosamine pyrophosphatase LpxH
MRTLVLSDLHLGSRHCNVELLEEVLRKESFDRLVLNGDTINNVNFRKLTPRHWAILDHLRDVGRERELILIRGNHDHEWDYQAVGSRHAPRAVVDGTRSEPATVKPLTTGHLLPSILDVPMLEEYRLEVQGQPYIILHGDRFDPTLNFQVVTEVAFAAYQLTTKVNQKLAKWLKKKSKKWGGILELVRARSVVFAREEGLAGIITGHTHFAEDVHVDGVHYVNTGSWTEVPCAYVTIGAEGVAVHQVLD